MELLGEWGDNMTIPMLPGWWDANKEAATGLMQTLARGINPYFDAQMALMNNIRENPEQLQGAVNMSYLNPEGFAQMFGPKMLQKMATMGQPSSDALIEQEIRVLANKNIADVPPTVAARAATQKLGVPSAARERIEQATADSAETEATQGAYNFLRTKKLNDLTDPVALRRAQTVLDTITEFPELENIDVSQMARDFIVDGPTEEFNRKYEGLIGRVPNAAKLFDTTVDFLRASMREEALDRRASQRLQAQFNHNDAIYKKQVYADARKLVKELDGLISIDDAFKLFTEGEQALSAPARAIMQERADLKLRGERQRVFGTIVDDFALASKERNKDRRKFTTDQVAARLSSLLGGLPISIVDAKINGTLFGTETVFELARPEGQPEKLTGVDIARLINDPASVEAILAERDVSRMNAQEVLENLKAFEGLENDPGSQAMINLLRSRLQQIERQGARARQATSSRPQR